MLLSLLIVSAICNLCLYYALCEAERDARMARRSYADAACALHKALKRQNELTRRTLTAEADAARARKLALACRHLPKLSGGRMRLFDRVYEN